MPDTARLRAYCCALGLCAACVGVVAYFLHTPTALTLGVLAMITSGLAAEWYAEARQLRERLELATVTDIPTGVLTHSAFETARSATGYAAVIEVSLEDIDDIADEYGWPCAEAVLSHVANVICASVREHDPVGKTGEGQFSVLLGDVELEVAQRICTRLEHNIATTPFSNGHTIIELAALTRMIPAEQYRHAA